MFGRKYKCIYAYNVISLVWRSEFTVGKLYRNTSWDSSYLRFRDDKGVLRSLQEKRNFKLCDLKYTLEKL
jgi:hypothetical protein